MIWTSVYAGADRFHAALSYVDGGVSVVVFTESLDGRTWVSEPGLRAPTVFRSIRNAVSGSALMAVGKGQDDGQCWLITDSGFTRALGLTGGEQCVGIEGLGGGVFRVAFVRDNSSWQTWEATATASGINARQVDAQPVPHGWIDGWTDYKHGQPLWIPEHRHFTDGQHELGVHLTVGAYTVGQSYVKPGCDALGPHGWQRVCDSNTPIPPYTAALGSRIVVAMSADNPQFVCSDDFGPMPVNTVTIPTIPPIPNKTLAFLVDGAPGKPYFADESWPDGELGVLHKVTETSKYEARVKLAEDERRVFYSYRDADTPPPADFVFPRPDGVPTLPMTNLYPLKGETKAAFDERARKTFERMSKEGLFAIYACGFLGKGTDGARTEQQVVDSLETIAKLAANPKCRLVTPFTWIRDEEDGDGIDEDDGVSKVPSVAETCKRFEAATPNPHNYPTWDELVPVDPPPTPEPEPEPEPEPTPFPFEVFLMAISAPMTLLRSSLFIPSKNAPGRYLYPAPGKAGFYLSLAQDQKGGITVSETQNDGGAEQFLWERDRGLATVGDSTNPIGGGYPVMNDGEPKS